VEALAARFPVLFGDLSQWLRVHADSARIASNGPVPARVPYGGGRVLFGPLDPEDVLRELESEAVGATLCLYPTVAGFLHFLGQAGAERCIEHGRWRPLLLLPLAHASHLQQWLARTRPRDWPWALANAWHFNDAATAQVAARFAAQLFQLLTELTAQLLRQAEARYADRAAPAEILRKGHRKLRALALAFEGSAYQQYCARDIAEGMRGVGIEGRELILPVGAAMNYELAQHIVQFDPDVLVLNGRRRANFTALPANLCVLSWDQDYVLCCARAEDGRRDLLMSMVRDWLTDAQLNGVCARRVRHVNIGTNQRMYYPAEKAREPEFDVLFIGNVHPLDSYRRHIGFDRLDANVQKVMLHARERLADWVRSRGEGEAWVVPDLDALMRQSMSELGFLASGDERTWRNTVFYFRYRIAHMLLRELYICALADLRPGLFGRGWENYPAVARLAHGPVENGPELRELIHRSAINVHLHTWTVHHPRLYDTAAAGGFLLVGRVPEEYPLERVFEPGEELDSFGSIAELRQKIRFYLDRPDLRREMAARAAERALRQHTMEHRMEDVKQFLREAGHDQH